MMYLFPLKGVLILFYFALEAAPRFELGIRVLQTPALPLGHAAQKLHFNLFDSVLQ